MSREPLDAQIYSMNAILAVQRRFEMEIITNNFFLNQSKGCGSLCADKFSIECEIASSDTRDLPFGCLFKSGLFKPVCR